MKRQKIFIFAAITLLALYCFGTGCATDPIKSVKNNPDRMEILMNHIANDDAFREKMAERLMKTGDKQKFAETLCTDEDFSKTLLSKITEAPKGVEDMVNRVGNRRELITKAIERALQMPEYHEALLDALLANAEMVEYLKTSEKLKAALEGKTVEAVKEAEQTTQPKE